MVHAVVPPAELRAYTDGVARTLVQIAGHVLALVKDNLNAAEDEVERRRWLFAHEAENQLTSAKAFSRRAKEQRAERAAGDLSQCDRSALDVRRRRRRVAGGCGMSPDAAARGPLQTPTVAAMAQRTPAAMTRPLCASSVHSCSANV